MVVVVQRGLRIRSMGDDGDVFMKRLVLLDVDCLQLMMGISV